MERIIVLDSLLEKEELEKARNIIDKKGWHFGHKSNSKYDVETPFWSVTLDDEEFFTKQLKHLIEKTMMKKLDLVRVYANGHTFGQDGSFHIDDKDPDAFTFVFYLTDIDPKDQDAAGGYIFFKLPEYKHTLCYEPKYNRGIFFPSNYTHRANAFTRYVMDLRITVAWKFKLSKNSNAEGI
jgi:hypothetical protein